MKRTTQYSCINPSLIPTNNREMNRRRRMLVNDLFVLQQSINTTSDITPACSALYSIILLKQTKQFCSCNLSYNLHNPQT